MEAVSQFFNGIANNINGLASNVAGSIKLNISLDSTPHEKTMTFKRNHEKIMLPAYIGQDDISGTISMEISQSEKYDHMGLKCYLIGYLEIFNENNLSTEFMMISKELEPAGFFMQNKSWKFKFSHFDKEYQSFKGSAGQVKYFIRAALTRNVLAALVEEEEFAVLKNEDPATIPLAPTILNVGVDQRLHIEFKLGKNSYHVKEWVDGKVTFHSVKMGVLRMEISLVRKESLGTPDNLTSKSKVLQTFEVMDGCPDEGVSIPFRMCMRGVKNLTPSYKNIHNRLFIRHWFNVTIFSDTGHRYFKQAEITFFRKKGQK